jgi:hypothetical protein
MAEEDKGEEEELPPEAPTEELEEPVLPDSLELEEPALPDPSELEVPEEPELPGSSELLELTGSVPPQNQPSHSSSVPLPFSEQPKITKPKTAIKAKRAWIFFIMELPSYSFKNNIEIFKV